MPKRAEVALKSQLKHILRIVGTTKHAKRDTLLIYISYGLGLRACEMAGLRFNQVIDHDGNVLDAVMLTETKGDEDNAVYIEDDDVKKALLDYYHYRKHGAGKNGRIFSLNEPLFLSQKGGRFTNKTMQKCFERIYKLCMLKGFSSHSGRRTLASWLDDQGYSIETIRAILRQKNISTTSIYIQNNPLRIRKVMRNAMYK
jgi:integrase/recombinase XerD